jgi:hypothetical protein
VISHLAIPDQLHLALFLEQQKAVLVGQRSLGFDEPNDHLLFLIRQSWHDLERYSVTLRNDVCSRLLSDPIDMIGH